MINPALATDVLKCACIGGTSQVALVVKNPPVNARLTRDAGLIPGLGRSPGEGNGNPLQYPCLGNPMDRGAWQATVNGASRVRQDLATKLPPGWV